MGRNERMKAKNRFFVFSRLKKEKFCGTKEREIGSIKAQNVGWRERKWKRL
jgi:hypothetical protein